MSKSNGPSYIVTRRIYADEGQQRRLEKLFNMAEKMYNACMKQARRQWYRLQNNADFMKVRERYLASDVKSERREIAEEMFVYIKKYRLDKSSLEKYINVMRKKCFHKVFGSTAAQMLADEVSQSINKAIFSNKKTHYRKKGTTHSFEGKSAGACIKYLPNEGMVSVFDFKFPLKNIRDTDTHMKTALSNRHIARYRITREPFKSGNRYFLQIVFHGVPPAKTKLGNGTMGCDQGTSTLAYYTQDDAGFIVLAEGVEKYIEPTKKLQRKLEHKRRCNNPDHYNPDGTYKKGCKTPWVESKSMKRTKQKLLDIYRQKRIFVKQDCQKVARRIVSSCDTIILEKMNWRALAKRSKKPTEKTDKTVTTKAGKTVNKCKKKKRYGQSILMRAPGAHQKAITDSIERLGGKVKFVNMETFCASQYDPITQEKEKLSLNQRTVNIDGHLVQRDLKSAFLLSHAKRDLTLPNFKACKKDFDNLLRLQENVIEQVRLQGDTTRNFGLRDFNQSKNA